MNKQFIAGFAVAALVLVGAVTFASWNGSTPVDAGNTSPIVGGTADNLGTTTVSGVITCLPHKGDGPHTMECAFGLKAPDGTFYALQDLWTVAPDMTETEVSVRVTGAVSTPAADEKYDIVGVIKVTKVEKL